MQAALDAWREEYNTDRPHQSLAMVFPASRFTPAVPALELRVPAQFSAPTREPKPPQPSPGPLPAGGVPVEVLEPVTVQAHNGLPAVEVDRVVPASGNLWIGGQQVWLAPGRGCSLQPLLTDPQPPNECGRPAA
jgi:hypothetical protein